MGFTVEGRRRRSLWVDGDFVDEYSMAKLLP
jgi:RimJ/RimL family protein N-acetyltransferase